MGHYKRETRRVTALLIEQCEGGVCSWEAVARACLNYMSEADVSDMAECEGFTSEND